MTQITDPIPHSNRASWGLYGWMKDCTSFWIMQDSGDRNLKHKWRKVAFWGEADFSSDAWDEFMIDDAMCVDRATIPEMKAMIASIYSDKM